jgi:FemAB-related protein (PEP-CTERM system-associated)
MTLTVEPFEGSAEEWDAALGGFEGGSFCHRMGWRSVMEDALGHRTFWRVARDADGEIAGLLPLVRVRSRLFGDYLVSMPFLNYGGPLGSSEARQALAGWAADTAAELRVDLLELRNRLPQESGELVENARKLTVVKELPDTTEALWEKGLKAKVRSQVRRPLKEGMEIDFGPELLDDFYDVFATTMRDLGTPVLPRPFFQKISEALGDATIFAVVRHEGEPVAAGCGLSWQGEFEITWAGASRAHARLAPNMLLYWGLMEESVRRGMSAFNFGRCSPDSGTHRFKRQWGSEDHVLPWLQWSPSGVPSTPDPDSPKFRAATNVWSRLPVGMTNVIGPRLSRVIP